MAINRSYFMFNEFPPGPTAMMHRRRVTTPPLLTVSHVILVGANFGDAQTRSEVTFHSLTSISIFINGGLMTGIVP